MSSGWRVLAGGLGERLCLIRLENTTLEGVASLGALGLVGSEPRGINVHPLHKKEHTRAMRAFSGRLACWYVAGSGWSSGTT